MKLLSLHIIFILICVFAVAQEQQYFRQGAKVQRNHKYEFDNYTNENGLSNNAIVEIFQDSYGFMWFGTENGLNKFDGYNFTMYLNSANDSSSISNNYIMDIDEDIYGNLWIATKNGLNKLNRENGTFKRYYSEESNKNGLRNNFITSILVDTEGDLWISTWGGYLHQFNIQSEEFRVFTYETKYDLVNIQYDLVLDDDLIWILNGGSSTMVFNKSTHQFTNINQFVSKENSEGELKNINSGHTCMIKDTLGNYYFGNYHGRGAFLNIKNGNVENLMLASTYTIIPYKDFLLLGGFQFGLLFYDIDKNAFEVIQRDESNPQSLPDNFIWKIFIDHSENIWIGTQNGLAKYASNKSKFKTIKHYSGNDKTLVSNKVTDIKYGKDGSLWVATYSGISKLNLSTFKCENFKNDLNNPKSMQGNRVQCIYEDIDTTLWIGYWTGRGFDRFNRTDKTFSHFEMDHREDISGYDWYNGFLEDSLGNFYPLQWGGAFSAFNRKLLKFETISGSQIFQRFKINKALLHHQNKLWVRSAISNEELNDFTLLKNDPKLNPNNPRSYLKLSYEYPHIILPFNLSENIEDFHLIYNKVFITTKQAMYIYDNSKNEILKLLELQNIQTLCESNDKKGVWIGTNKGLYYAEFLNSKKLNLSDQIYYKNKEINCVFKDNLNQIWIGTEQGLFQNFDSTLSNAYLSSERINIIQQDDKNRLLIGTDKGLYYINEIKSEKITPIFDSYIHDIYEDEDQDIWIGMNNGLTCMKSNGDTIHYYHESTNANSISTNTIYKITGNKKGKIFLGTEKGINTIIKSKDTILRNDEATQYSPQSNLFTCGLTDSNGDIWLGNYKDTKSINKFDPVSKTFTHYFDRDYDSTSYKGNMAYFIFEDSKNQIWIGSDKGLNKFNAKTEEFILYDKDNGFPNNNILSMEEDDRGNFWLGSLSGLIKFNQFSGEIEVYNQNDGVSSNTFDAGASEKLPDGRMVFATDKGLTIFHPDSIKPFREEPNFLFTKFFIFDSLLYQDLSETDKIELQYDQNNFTIEFAALDFIAPEKQHYQYILDGYDKNWMQVDYSKRQAKYTDLPYGNYTFLLKASNHDGYWSNEIKKLEIKILPPWYHTKLAYVFYFLVFIGFSFLIGTVRIRLVKERNKELEIEIEKRTTEILHKNEEINQQEIAEIIKEHRIQNMKERFSGQEDERKRISRELHDGIAGNLTGIKLFLENLNDGLEGNNKDMLIKDIDRLYNEVRNISHDLLPPEFQDTSVREVLQFYIEQLVLRSELNMAISFHPVIGWQNLDENIQIEIYRIVQELTQNAIKHAECQNIEIEIVKHSETLSIMVEDDGKGMKVIDKSFGIGLKSLFQRITSLGGNMNIDSKPGRGTVIDIEIPF